MVCDFKTLGLFFLVSVVIFLGSGVYKRELKSSSEELMDSCSSLLSDETTTTSLLLILTSGSISTTAI